MITLHDFGGVLGDNLWTLSFGLSQFHGHNSWLMCEVALITPHVAHGMIGSPGKGHAGNFGYLLEKNTTVLISIHKVQMGSYIFVFVF